MSDRPRIHADALPDVLRDAVALITNSARDTGDLAEYYTTMRSILAMREDEPLLDWTERMLATIDLLAVIGSSLVKSIAEDAHTAPEWLFARYAEKVEQMLTPADQVPPGHGDRMAAGGMRDEDAEPWLDD